MQVHLYGDRQQSLLPAGIQGTSPNLDHALGLDIVMVSMLTWKAINTKCASRTNHEFPPSNINRSKVTSGNACGMNLNRVGEIGNLTRKGFCFILPHFENGSYAYKNVRNTIATKSVLG